mmetsp:Transcript_25251/g.63575  ORF Transcript_25251/g.63575 Transcript_25251/m.63575 type:complete len:299 (-) Transcript_25251:1195-2091(-)
MQNFSLNSRTSLLILSSKVSSPSPPGITSRFRDRSCLFACPASSFSRRLWASRKFSTFRSLICIRSAPPSSSPPSINSSPTARVPPAASDPVVRGRWWKNDALVPPPANDNVDVPLPLADAETSVPPIRSSPSYCSPPLLAGRLRPECCPMDCSLGSRNTPVELVTECPIISTRRASGESCPRMCSEIRGRGEPSRTASRVRAFRLSKSGKSCSPLITMHSRNSICLVQPMHRIPLFWGTTRRIRFCWPSFCFSSSFRRRSNSSCLFCSWLRMCSFSAPFSAFSLSSFSLFSPSTLDR